MSESTCKKRKRRRLPLARRGAVVACAIVLLTSLSQAGAAAAAPTDEVARIAELMQLEPGMHVADVGAGDGEWAEALARVVGESGHVYATEIKQDLVDEMHDRMERAGLANVSAILGDDEHTGLAEGCCDGILLRLVYHHFTDPAAMRADLRRALRPGARIVLIDIVPQTHWRDLPGVPDRGGHGIPLDVLKGELESDGFEVLQAIDDWPGDEDHFCAVLRVKNQAP